MKTFLVLGASLFTSLAAALHAPAVTVTNGLADSTPPSAVITNLVNSMTTQAALNGVLSQVPTTTFANARIEIEVGVVIQGDSSFANSLAADFTIHTNFFLGGEVQSSPGGFGINGIYLRGGYKYAWTSAEIYIVGSIGRDLIDDRWQGEIGIGAAWMPLQDSANAILSKSSLYLEQSIVIDSGMLGSRGSVPSETRAGAKFSLPGF